MRHATHAAPGLEGAAYLAMISANLFFVATVALAGCSSLDADVRPKILQANVSVDQALPTESAEIEWVVSFDTDPNAQRNVALEQVAIIGDLEGEPFVHELNMSFPQDFDGQVKSGSEPTLVLVSQGITNGELVFLCDPNATQDFQAFVQIGFWEDEATQYLPFSSEPYEIHCL